MMWCILIRGLVVAVFFDSALCDMAYNRFCNSFENVVIEKMRVIDPKSFNHNPDL